MSMINNLFSIFDPSTSFLSIAWVTLSIPLIFLLSKRINIKNKKRMATRVALSAVGTEIKQLTKSSNKKAIRAIMLCLFYRVLIINLVAILPFNFTPTAHISITLFYSLTLWTATIINAISNFTKNSIIHLTPIGTPTALINFIVLIEIVRQIIRPITLAVRLIANIVAGHLLINLLSNFSLNSVKNSTVRLIPMTMLILLETAVAFIQAYVITILVTLYYRDTF